MNTVKKLSASEKFPSNDVKRYFFVLSFCQLLSALYIYSSVDALKQLENEEMANCCGHRRRRR